MTNYTTKSAVLFLVFNRPDTTEKVFRAIQNAKPAKLYLACDGPRKNNVIDQRNVKEVRELILNGIDWECEVKNRFQSENLGCKNAVSSGITWFFENEEEGIILEDDCLPSESFFNFCDSLLEKYREDQRVSHIGGVNFLGHNLANNESYYFSRFTHVWGWASWRRVWRDYDVHLTLLDKFLANNHLIDIFPDKRVTKYLSRELKRVQIGALNTWDYQYLFLNLIKNGLCIIPAKNLVENIGFGVNATHEQNDAIKTGKAHGISPVLVHPNFLVPETKYDISSLLKINDLFLSAKIRTKIKTLFR